MRVKVLPRSVFACWLGWACPPLTAQLSLGEVVPAPTWKAWANGDPVVIGGDPAPACTVFAFYTTPARAPAFGGDAHYLADLQQRFGGRGLCVVGVVDEGAAESTNGWASCRVAVDSDGATTAAWSRDGSALEAVVIDKQGIVMFLGAVGSGLVDAVNATLAGGNALDRERASYAIRQEVLLGFDNVAADGTRVQLEAVLAHAPHDGLVFGLLYLTEALKAVDPVAAKKVRDRAVQALATESRPLAVFADLAMRGDPTAVDLASELRTHLQPLAAAARADAAVQLAYLRALVLAGDDREVGRHAMRMQKVVLGAADTCLDFVAILTRDKNAVIHRDLTARVLSKAEALGATPRLLAAARYGAALRCAEDREAARTVLTNYLSDNELRTQINNDAWYLMTELPTMGRFDWFAAGLAERMLEQRDDMDAFEFDTAALAMFQIGRFEAAVELQQTAITKGGGGNPEYTARLHRYKAKAAPAPR